MKTILRPIFNSATTRLGPCDLLLRSYAKNYTMQLRLKKAKACISNLVNFNFIKYFKKKTKTKRKEAHTRFKIFFTKLRLRGSSDEVLWLLSDLLLRGVVLSSLLLEDLLCRLLFPLELELLLELALLLDLEFLLSAVKARSRFLRSSVMSSLSSCWFRKK